MDRVSHLRGAAGASGSGDSTLDTSSPPSEAYMSANESSKYFSFADSSFDMSSSLPSTSAATEPSNADQLMPNLSPTAKKDILDFKIGKQIDAANILSGGENIFEGNDNSFDGSELVIDDNAVADDTADADRVKDPSDNNESESKSESKPEPQPEKVPKPLVEMAPASKPDSEAGLVLEKQTAPELEPADTELQLELEPQMELLPEPVLGIDHGPEPSLQPELAIVSEPELDIEPVPELELEPEVEPDLEPMPEVDLEPIPGPDLEVGAGLLQVGLGVNAGAEMEVVLQINGNNLNAIDIGNGLYLYRRDGQEELAAIQLIDGDPNYKFLKVRDNAEGNLEVYEEIQVEVPAVQANPVVNIAAQVPAVVNNNVTNDPSTSRAAEGQNNSAQMEPVASTSGARGNDERESNAEVNVNGRMMKLSESRKSPVVGSFTPMTVHSTPNKEGKPLTKTMVDMQLDPNRHSDNVKKTIEVHTDNVKNKSTEAIISKQVLVGKSKENTDKPEIKDKHEEKLVDDENKEIKPNMDQKCGTSEETPKASDTAGKNDFKENSKDSKSHESNKKPTASAIESDVVEKEVVPINNNVGDVVFSKVAHSAVLLPLIKDESNVASSSVPNEGSNSKSIEKVMESRVESMESIKTVKTHVCGNDKIMTTDKGKLHASGTPTTNAELGALDSISDVSSTSNVEANASKIISAVSYTDSAVENASSIMPSNNTQGDKENDNNKITGVQTKLDDTPIEKIEDTQAAKIVESIIKTIDQVDGANNAASQINNYITKSPGIIAKTSIPESKPQPKDKSSISTHDQKQSETKVIIVPVTKVKPVSTVAHSAVPLPHLTEEDFRPLNKSVHHMSVPDVKLSEKITQRPAAASRSPATQNAVVLPAVTDSKPPDKIRDALAISTVKQPDKIPRSASSSMVKLPDKTTGSVAVKVNPPEQLSNITKVHEIKTQSGDNGALPKPKQNVTFEKKSVSMPVVANLSEKEEHLVTSHVVKALQKGSKSSMVPEVPPEKCKNSPNETKIAPFEIKKLPLEISSDTIIKPARPDAHIPVVANIGNKPSSKHISLITKVEGVKKPDIIHNQKETMAKKNVDNHSIQLKIESRDVTVPITSKPNPEIKPVNNNHSAPVPFGKWTEANRQEFLNKFKEVKAPVSSNSKQIKNSNDLNRRDVLKKIDSQRAQTIINNATAKAQEKLNVKNETVFSSKVVAPKVETKIPVKNESTDRKPKQAVNKIPAKQEKIQKTAVSSTVSASSTATNKAEPAPREGKATATMASLIDMTIEDMINRVVVPKNVPDEPKTTTKVHQSDKETSAKESQSKKTETKDEGSLDDIEMKMNELHGIPFVERPPHQLPKVAQSEIKSLSKKNSDKNTAIPKISIGEPKIVNENVIDIESEDEVIEHEPVTGDIELKKDAIKNMIPAQEKKTLLDKSTAFVQENKSSNKDFITENDFDKFARRNSVTYENCLTVNYDRKEPHSLAHTVKEKDQTLHINTNAEMIRIEPKTKLPHKQNVRHNVHTGKGQGATKYGAVPKDFGGKNYQSKIHCAYQSALTAKHQVAQPITIIEDKPVKVVFVESNTGFIPSQLNVQGQELSPTKKPATELDNVTNTADVVDSDMVGVIDENKQHDKKTKHQRKQVLTPVEAPELELIQPNDIGIESSPKKRRKFDDNRSDKQSKNLVHKKSYLLGRNITTDDKTTTDNQVVSKDSQKEIINQNEDVSPDHKDAASAIDNLVKAAELIENQEETNMSIVSLSTDSQSSTPVKRGRGRPRKYPIPEGTDNKTPTPQKKPRLIDAKPTKRASISDEQDDDSSDDGIIRENWTMGKINENIVCPICNKLFRSENVVFKHVKHCTGVSPNRSDSDKRSPRRTRLSQESEDTDYETNVGENKKQSPKKRKSKEPSKDESKPEQAQSEVDKDEVIVIEDTPIKPKQDKKIEDHNEDAKVKIRNRTNNLVCEFCGKTFRQLSYLVSHKLQHKKEQAKKTETDNHDPKKLQVFSCDVCKKEFRKLHHLVQHRIIHNPESVPKRTLRKSSLEQNEHKLTTVGKQNEDASAAFRCEPCDKSFRKLHHLVEHRETHDGINRQKPAVPAQPSVEKPPPPQCEICKKTFRKLHHLIDHKEQHLDTSSEKSDDKSVNSLATKDIIHECSLCYMVFPNEHSLNKHTGICSKKKRQSKQPKDIPESESSKENLTSKPEDNKDEQSADDIPEIVAQEVLEPDDNVRKERNDIILNITSDIQKDNVVSNLTVQKETETKLEPEITISNEVTENPLQKDKNVKPIEVQSTPPKRDFQKSEADIPQEKTVVPEKIKKLEHKENKTQNTPKRKTPLKDKVAPTVTKRKRTIDTPLPTANVVKPSVESSDDDEVRYMLNPDYKVEETSEGKTFMKVRAAKRNSLQIERPNSNDHAKRRISLQHPPKVSRLKPKAPEAKPKATESTQKAPELKPKVAASRSKSIETKASLNLEPIPKLVETEAMLSTDSDDSDVKYSFPKTAPEISKTVERTPKAAQRKTTRKSLEKRKSLVGIAKRKSLGKTIAKLKAADLPARLIKKRSAEAEHRCDCGQLFTSAALLARHTSVAHTPPRIRRRRASAAPPPPVCPDPRPLPANKTTAAEPAKTRNSIKPQTADVTDTGAAEPTKARKSIKPRSDDAKTDATDSKLPVRTRKSSKTESRSTSTDDKLKSAKKKESPGGRKPDNLSEKKTESSSGKKTSSSGSINERSTVKTRRSGAHSGVPVPHKLRKLLQKK